MICFQLEVPAEFQSRARYALEILALRWGVPFQFGESEGAVATVVYGAAVPTKSNAYFIKFDRLSYDPQANFYLDSQTRWVRKGSDWDPVASTFRLVSLLDESFVQQDKRDRKGRFLTTALSLERQKARELALVESQAEFLGQQLFSKFSELSRRVVPRWPSQKKWAVVLSHDTDALCTQNPSEILYNLVKGVLRRDKPALQAAWHGVSFRGPVEENPLYGFSTWADIEESLGVKSCFYLFGNPRFGKREINDCRSHVLNQKMDWGRLRDLADRGFEFGLHAPIYAKEKAETFQWLKDTLEAKLARRIWGVRHHYWALNWKNPCETYRLHQKAGFRYDSSLAWIDSPGFRAGTSLPFAPFERETDRALDYTVIPAAFMDRHVLLGANPEHAFEQTLSFFKQRKKEGALVVVNWHTECAREAFGMKHYATVLKRVVAEICGSECWVATPEAVVRHWTARHALLSGGPRVAPRIPVALSSSSPELFA